MEGNTSPINDQEHLVKQMFVILDKFDRDSLYKQYGVELKFKELEIAFEAHLDGFLRICKGHRLTGFEMELSDYIDQVEFDGEDSDLKNKENRFKKESPKASNRKSTLLFFAANQPIPQNQEERECLQSIIRILVQKCPSMIKYPLETAENEGCGPTPLHLIVVKETKTKEEKKFKAGVFKAMIGACTAKDSVIDLNKYGLKGKIANGSLFRGKTILNIAARTQDIRTIKLLLRKGSEVCFDSYNEYKDNMYHSLIRYAFLCPDKEKDIVETIKQIEEHLDENKRDLETNNPDKKGRPEMLWVMKNRDGVTPLQLAAKLGRVELFKFILNRNVYRLNAGDTGSIDDDVYDITEIETMPIMTDEEKNDMRTAEIEQAQTKTETHVSVLLLLERHSSRELVSRFVSQGIVGKTISEKWKYYRYWSLIWAFLHILIMAFFSWQSIVRSKFDNPIQSQTSSSSIYNDVRFVVAFSSVATLYGFVCLCFQLKYHYSYCYKQKSWKFFSHPNAFMLFGFLLIIDFIAMLLSSGYVNFLLPFIILLGWYLVLYFLLVIERFSFFTVLIKYVISDCVQFAVVMGVLLIGFSVALFTVMQGAAESEEDAFEDIGKTLVKMFTIMLGIGELGVLFDARYPALAIVIFVLFVLTTTILLLNALIAIMSNTCSRLTSEVSVKTHVRVQRMLAIIHLEGMLPRSLHNNWKDEIKETQGIHGKKKRIHLSLGSEEMDENLDEMAEDRGSPMEQLRNAITLVSEKAFKHKKRRNIEPIFYNTKLTLHNNETGTVDVHEFERVDTT